MIRQEEDNDLSRPYVTTVSGRRINPYSPDRGQIHIGDIAHNLSQLCRFNGATRQFYSVAQHSVLVSRLAGPEAALEGLLHDAAEAYLGDIPRLLKRSPAWREYRMLEDQLTLVIEAVFDLDFQAHHQAVKAADWAACATEIRDLMPQGPEYRLPEGVEAAPEPILAWEPQIAEMMFLETFAVQRRLKRLAKA